MGDTFALWSLVYVVGGLLAFVVTLLIFYAVIRTAVSHALRSHTRWVDDGKP
ncbi:hypothetical protein AB3M83_05650 [Microbacterium sp. 179-B 1A2 NHS]|uniref:hypothetical protein n=1 Tax=Microbacterium sp. 179-B 1A2 NHS TaxID=3142383 RepID=UPI0039A302BA